MSTLEIATGTVSVNARAADNQIEEEHVQIVLAGAVESDHC